MVIHTFHLRFKPEASQAQIDRAIADIQAFQGKVPGLLETRLGWNFSTRSDGATFGAVMTFADRATLDAYNAPSALHGELLQWLAPLVEAREVDFEPLGQ